MSQEKLTLLKFGSSVLRSEADLPGAVHEIYRHVRAGEKVLAVVSALGNTTDRLLRLAEGLFPAPRPDALAPLLATGETTAAALLGLALDQAGIPARVLDPAQAGLKTRGPVLDAEPAGLDVAALLAALAQCDVVVLPGFAGRDEHGATTLLGRGGSDFTALYLAGQLKAQRCILLKDVDGLYAGDPAAPGRKPARFRTVRWQTALEVGGGVVQPKAIQYAQRHGLSFTISAPGSAQGSEIGPGPDRLETAPAAAPPLRVALLGHGTVGGGLYRHLASLPKEFSVTGVAVRDVAKARAAGVPAALLTTDAESVISRPCDIVVELIGGIEPARSLISAALRAGRDVVTANKAVLARYGLALHALARKHGAQLRYSASVGGVLPAIEAVHRAAQAGPVERVEGVLNGTCNFVLDRIAAGLEPAAAVRLAQEAGFAEADPTLDLDGSDTAHKLVLLARAAFGSDLPFEKIARTGIAGLDPAFVRDAQARGQAVRLVASCHNGPDGVSGQVSPVALALTHPLALARDAENRLLVTTKYGARFYSGQGAGRWPTAEAVLADLFDIARDRAAPEDETGKSAVQRTDLPLRTDDTADKRSHAEIDARHSARMTRAPAREEIAS